MAMYPVTQDFLEAIRADARQVCGRLDIYYTEIPVSFDNNKLQSIELMEEVSADSTVPIGVVSSNELVVTLINDDHAFSPDNPNSPFAIRKGLKIVPYLGVNEEYVPLGVFWVYDYELQEESSIRLTCYDRLYELLNRDTPYLMPRMNTSIIELFTELFTALGLSSNDYVIDQEIDFSIRIGWIQGRKVKEALQFLSTASLSNVFVDRLGKIRVTNAFRAPTIVEEWTSEQIFDAQIPRGLTSTFESSQVYCFDVSLGESTELLKLTQRLLPGINHTRRIEFNQPLGCLNSVVVSGSQALNVQLVQLGVQGLDLDITNNSSQTTTADITVYGRPIILSKHSISNVDEECASLTIKNELIQDPDFAKGYETLLNNLLSDGKSLVTVKTRGNPAIELLDGVRLVTQRAGVFDAVVLRQHIKYDGAMEVETTLRAITVPKQCLFVTPNLVVEASLKTST